MSMTQSKKRRTKLFIIRGFQIRYIFLILVFMFAIAILSGYIVYFTAWVMFGEQLARVYPQGDLLVIVNKVNLALLVRLALISPLVILIGLVLSNRIAGPIYSIQNYLKELLEGRYDKRLKLREKDELKDVAEAINSLVSKLKNDQSLKEEIVEEMESQADKMEEIIRQGGKGSKLPDIVSSFRKNLEKLKILQALCTQKNPFNTILF